MKQVRTVISADARNAKVKVKRSSACGDNCASCGLNCGGGEIVVTARNDAGAGAGDTVELVMKSSRVLTAAAWVYIIPTAFFVAGYLVFERIFGGELAGAGGGLAAAAAVYAVIAALGRKNANKYAPVIEKVIDM